jgi:phosphoserine phosphatase
MTEPMSSVATFICPSDVGALNNELLDRLVRLLPATRQIAWLEHGIAADIFFYGPVTPVIKLNLQNAFAGQPIDYFVQPTNTRRKKLLVADMDSTVIEQECLDELADFAGLRPRIAEITARAMRGEIDFAPALRERVAMLKGLPADAIDEIVATRISLTPGGETLVRTMRAHGAFTVLVSGGFTAFTRQIAARVGFDADEANVLGITNGRLSGLVEEPILGRRGKREILDRFRQSLEIEREDVLAVGDGANDLDMLSAAGLGVAFHAKPAVAAAADARVDHADLTALLYAQGYRRADFSL